MTDTANQVLWRWDHGEPFGNSPENSNPSGLGTFAINYRFPGQYLDRASNTHYNYFRDYDPAIGRYVQSDPIGLAGGPNTFSYAAGNPVRSFDRLGLFITTVQATCAVNPMFCAEILGQIVENTSQITQGCVTDEAAAAAGALHDLGVLATIIVGIVNAPTLATTLGNAASSINALSLGKALASQSQMGQTGVVIAGAGSSKAFSGGVQIAKQFGGNSADWVKKTSTAYVGRDGTKFQTHWVENLKTGQRVEFKTKLGGGE